MLVCLTSIFCLKRWDFTTSHQQKNSLQGVVRSCLLLPYCCLYFPNVFHQILWQFARRCPRLSPYCCMLSKYVWTVEENHIIHQNPLQAKQPMIHIKFSRRIGKKRAKQQNKSSIKIDAYRISRSGGNKAKQQNKSSNKIDAYRISRSGGK